MESAPGTALNVTNSSGFSISYNSDDENLKEKRDLEVKNSKSSSSNGSSRSSESDDGGSENGGYVSGGDDFVDAPERMVEGDLDGDSVAKAPGRADANGNGNANSLSLDVSGILLPNKEIRFEEVPVDDSPGVVGVLGIGELKGEKVVGDPVLKEDSFVNADKSLTIVLEDLVDKVETGQKELEHEAVLEKTSLTIGDLVKDGNSKEGAPQVLLHDEGEKELANPKSIEVVAVTVEEGYVHGKLNTAATDLTEEDAIKEEKSEVSADEQSGFAIKAKETSDNVIKDPAFQGVVTDQLETVIVGPAEDLVESDGQFTGGKDLVEESVQTDLSGSGVDTVEGLQKTRDSGIEELHLPTAASMNLGNGVNQISDVAEDLVDSKSLQFVTETKVSEPLTSEPAETTKLDTEVVNDQLDTVIVGTTEDLVESDGQFTGGEGLGEESVQADLSVSGVDTVEGLQKTRDSRIEELHLPPAAGMNLDNRVNLISDVAEDLSDPKSLEYVTESKISEPLTSGHTKTTKLETDAPTIDVSGEERNANPDMGARIADETTQDYAKIAACSDESESFGQSALLNKSVIEAEPVAHLKAKQDKPLSATVADEVEVLHSDKVDGGNGDKTGEVDSNDNSIRIDAAHMPANLENDQTNVSTEAELIVDKVSKEDARVETDDDDAEPDGTVTDDETEDMIFGSSEAGKQFLKELEQESGVGSESGAEGHTDSQRLDGQIVTDSDEEVDTDEEEGKEMFDSAALAALLEAATGSGSDGGNITITSQGGSRLFSVERPAGLGSSLRPMRPAPRSNSSNFFSAANLASGGDSESNLSEEERQKLEKLQQLRVKFLRIVHRLGHTPEDSIAAQVFYRLALVAGRQPSQLFSLDAAKKTALQLEAECKTDLDYSLNILVLGKTGVGKSATINSIFGDDKSSINAFENATTTVKELIGTVDGVRITVLDTPGLKSSATEQSVNRKILSSIKKCTKKCPPDIILYVDRLDTQTRDLNDLPLLKLISSYLGPSIWRSTIVTLTHGACAPPDGPTGSPLNYDVFVSQRSHNVQQSIGQAVGDLRLMNPSLMNPVSLVENHPSCRRNRDGQKVLPNGQSWKSQLLLLSYSMKILSEASSLSKPQDPLDHRKLFGFRVRSPPLPYFLSWLLQSRTHPKLSSDQGGENGDSDIDLVDLSDSDEEDVDEYEQLPPFKPLRNSQLSKLSKEQKKAYFEEYDYRVKLLQKKQWKEELRRMREIKKKGKVGANDFGLVGDDIDQDQDGSPAAVSVPLPDMALPPSFDGENPTHRYRFLEPTSQFLARPVLDTHGWDHDCGYDGVNMEHSLAILSRFPSAVAVQITKDKKEFNIHLDSSVSAKHGENGSSMVGFDIQNVGKQLAYVLRGETKFKKLKRNKMTAGAFVAFLGENVAPGFKIEDQMAVGKRLILVGSTGTVRSQGEAAYGANLEVRLREADYPIGQDQSSLGLSLVKWRGDLALGANLQSQISIGRNSKMSVRAGLNNKLSGQISVRISNSEQLQLALIALLPIARAIYKTVCPGVSENYSIY